MSLAGKTVFLWDAVWPQGSGLTSLSLELAPLLPCEDKSSDHQSLRLDGGAGTSEPVQCLVPHLSRAAPTVALTVESEGQDGPQGDRDSEAQDPEPLPMVPGTQGGDPTSYFLGPRPHPALGCAGQATSFSRRDCNPRICW